MTKVVVQSRRIVKPRPSDTNGHLPAHNIIPLSSADFGAPNYHSRSIHAFQAPTPRTSKLEEGMTNLLPFFRVFAGTLLADHNGRPAIHLNDQGVVFTEALADGTLADAMPFDPVPSLLQFLPPTEGAPELLLIQFTRFDCGGLAMGVAIHHFVGDGVASVGFLNCWGAMVRGEPLNYMPVHDRSLLMARNPPRPVFDHAGYATPTSTTTTRKCELVVKNFRFSGELANRVRARASQNAEKPYSRYVSVLAHAWRCISIARALRGDVVTRALIAVSGRNRLNPPVPAGYVGNVVFRACPETTVRELTEGPLQFVAELIQNAITRVDDEYVRSTMDELEIIQSRNGAAEPVSLTRVHVRSPHIKSTSWSSLPLYDLDFGWGRPTYVCPARYPEEGRLTFFQPPAAQGDLHVSVGLLEPDMASFEERIYDI